MLSSGIHQFSLSHKLVHNGADFQTLDCCYQFGIQPLWPKVCVALITTYDLFSYQNLEPLSYLFSFCIYPPLYTSCLVGMLLCCDNIKNWYIYYKTHSWPPHRYTLRFISGLFFHDNSFGPGYSRNHVTNNETTAFKILHWSYRKSVSVSPIRGNKTKSLVDCECTHIL